MRAVFKGALAVALLAGSSLAMTAPAEARYHDHTGTAIAAGIIGLGIGAAIASADHHDRYYANDGYGYDSYGYDAPVNYYAQPSYGYSYGVTYDRGYYDRGYSQRYDDRRWHDQDRHDRGGWDRDRDHGDHNRHW